MEETDDHPKWIYVSGVLALGKVKVENHGGVMLLEWHAPSDYSHLWEEPRLHG